MTQAADSQRSFNFPAESKPAGAAAAPGGPRPQGLLRCEPVTQSLSHSGWQASDASEGTDTVTLAFGSRLEPFFALCSLQKVQRMIQCEKPLAAREQVRA